MKKRKSPLPKRPQATLHETMVASVRYYETLYMVRDKDGTAIYCGNQSKAKAIVKILNARK